MKINQLVSIRFVLILSVRLVPIVQSTYLDSYQANYQNYNQQNSQSNLTGLESIQDETYVQNRDQVFLNHLNQLNYDGKNLFNYGNINRQYKRAQHNSTDEHLAGKQSVLTKRIALSALANIFGGNSDEEEKKVEKTADNQTDKSQPIKKENITLIEELNKNVTAGGIQDGNQSALLKNHLQNDRDIEALNRLINFSKNYENWSDHLKNPYNLNHHRQDLINLLGLNESNLSDPSSSNGSEPQDQTKNKFAFSPEYAGKTLFENNHFGFRPNNFLSSLLVNSNNEHEYLVPRFNKLTSSLSPAEAITEASDQNVSEYEDASRDEEEDGQPAKLIDNRNESIVNGKTGERRRKVLRNQANRMRQNGQRLRQRAKIRKTYDNNNSYAKNIAQNGFRPIDNKLLKEQSQISASTGVKRNRNYKSKNLADLSLVESTQQHQNDNNNSNNGSSRKRGNQSASSVEPEYHQLSISNQPYTLRQPNYRFPSGLYGKRLVNEIMNSQPNVRKTLVSTTSNKNSVVNNESAADHLDEENNETGKEETLNEQDKQLVTDKTKEFYEKNEEDLNESPVDELDNRDMDRDNNRDRDHRDGGTSNGPASNQPQQLSHQTNQQLSQQHQAMNNQQVDTQLSQPILGNQLSNQPEIETNENDSAENENESLNSTFTQTKESDNQERTAGKSKLMIGDLNKSAKQEKNSQKSKQQGNKKMNWKSVYQNFKHHDIYDKYSKMGKNSFNFDQDIPMSAYLSNENFKINLSGGKSDLDDDLAGFPYPNVQYNGKPTPSFGNHYYPLLKKKPYFGSSYPYPGFSSNPLNGMLFDKLSMPVIDSYAIEKLPAPSLTNSIKGALEKPLDNKFYNLENKLHHLNSKYSLNSLSPPPYALPPHLESTKYYEPKTHHDSKYHNLNHWTSPMITGFLLGVVPFSFLLASMAPTISAITSGSAAAAALGRRRRSVDSGELWRGDNDTVQSKTDLKQTKFDENVVCLSRLSTIITSLNELGKEGAKQDQAKVYFNELVDLQKKCEFNFKFPINLFQEMRSVLNLNEFGARDERTLKRLKDSYFSYSLGNSKMSFLETILNFLFSLDLISNKERTSPPNQLRTNQTGLFSNDVFSVYPPFMNFFHLREGKCVQEIICKLISNPKFEKGVFSNFVSLLVSMIPNNLANKYGLDVLVYGLKASKCTPGPTFC